MHMHVTDRILWNIAFYCFTCFAKRRYTQDTQPFRDSTVSTALNILLKVDIHSSRKTTPNLINGKESKLIG